MAKWFGKIGFSEDKEVAPGVWRSVITEREYYGDVYKTTRRLQISGEVNDSVTVANTISILADPHAVDYFYNMRYASFCGTNWKVSDVEVQYPRLVLTLGGVWNGDTVGSS